MEDTSKIMLQLMQTIAEETGRSIEELRPDPNETILERSKRHVNEYNAMKGKLDQEDGYNCPECKNRGDFLYAHQPRPEGMVYESAYPCRCMPIRRSIALMRASGLADTIRRQTLDSFRTDEPWQKTIAAIARDYLAEPGAPWFYIGGAVGSGKTHICTAISRQLLYAGNRLTYMLWTTESQKLKALVGEEGYEDELNRYKTAPVLYIDDCFKPVRDAYGPGKPSSADVRLLYDIVNVRYMNPSLRTLFSSERMLCEVIDIDEAVGSRIAERAGRFVIDVGRDPAKNQRLAGKTTL